MAAPKQTDPQYKLRLTPELKDRIETAARDHRRSMNAEIIDRLERSFDEEKEVDFLTMLADGQFMDNIFPPGLTGRIQGAAEKHRRSVQEEVIQALEAVFPPPEPFSLDWFNEEWIARILQAPEVDRPRMIEEANQVLKDNGEIYEVWLEVPKEGNRPSSVVLARRGAPRRLRFDQAEK